MSDTNRRIEKMKEVFENVQFENFETVISGTNLTTKMIENIKRLYFTPEVKKLIISILTQFTSKFYPDKDIPTIKEFLQSSSTQAIVGTYGTGKSHVMMFLGFLFGYGMDDDKIIVNYPNLKEVCWEILEKAIGKEIINYFSHFRVNNDFIIVFQDLIYGEQNTELGIKVLNIMNKKFTKLGVPEDQLYKIVREIDYEVLAKNWKKILENIHKKGIILLLEEFLRYYNDLTQTKEKPFRNRAGTAIQTFSDPFQADCSLAIILITQKPFSSIDENLEQVKDRLYENNLSFQNVGEIISNRFFNIPPESLNSIYEDYFKNSLNPSKSSIDEQDLKKNFPFHPKTIWSIEKFFKYYENQSRGFAKYTYYCHNEKNLFKNDDRAVDQLITIDTIYDYLVETHKGVASDKEKEIFDNYNAVNNDFISTQEKEHQEILSGLLKVVVSFSNPQYKWIKKELFSHFCDYNIEYLEEQWELLFENLDFITEDKDGKIYYNPTKTGDVNKYTDKMVEILDIDKLFKQLFVFRFRNFEIIDGVSISSAPEDPVYFSYKVRNEYGGKMKYLYLEYYSQFENTLRIAIDEHIIKSMNSQEIEDLDLENFVQGIIIFCRHDFSDNVDIDDIKNTVDDIINNLDEDDIPNEYLNDHRDYIKNSLLLVKPANLEEDNIKLLKRSFAEWTIRKIIVKAETVNADAIINDIKEYEKINTFLTIKDLKDNELKKIIEDINNDDVGTRNNYLDNLSSLKGASDEFKQIIDTQFTKGEKLGLDNWDEWKSMDWKEFKQIRDDFLRTLYPIKYPKYYYNTPQGQSKCLIDNYISHTSNYNRLFNSCFKNLIPNINEECECPTTEREVLDFCEKTLKKINVINEIINNNKVVFNKRIESESSELEDLIKMLDDEEDLNAKRALEEYSLPPYGYPPLFTLLLLFILYKLDKIKITYEGEPLDVDRFNRSGFKVKNYFANHDLGIIQITKPEIIDTSKVDNLYKFFNVIFKSIEVENGLEIWLSPSLCNRYITQIKNINMTQSNQEKFVRFISELPFSEISNKINDNVFEIYKLYNEILNSEEDPEESNKKFKIFCREAIFQYDNEDFFEKIQNIISRMNEIEDDGFKKLSFFHDEFQNLFIEERKWDDFFEKFNEYWERLLKIKRNFIAEEVL